eukprot:scaffold198850_cov15-Tisochrysis_lutea.AAC.1
MHFLLLTLYHGLAARWTILDHDYKQLWLFSDMTLQPALLWREKWINPSLVLPHSAKTSQFAPANQIFAARLVRARQFGGPGWAEWVRKDCTVRKPAVRSPLPGGSSILRHLDFLNPVYWALVVSKGRSCMKTSCA